MGEKGNMVDTGSFTGIGSGVGSTAGLVGTPSADNPSGAHSTGFSGGAGKLAASRFVTSSPIRLVNTLVWKVSRWVPISRPSSARVDGCAGKGYSAGSTVDHPARAGRSTDLPAVCQPKALASWRDRVATKVAGSASSPPSASNAIPKSRCAVSTSRGSSARAS